MNIEIGDTVHHRPTGEKWIVARAASEHVWPAGWPPCRALAVDCELLEKATPERVEWLKKHLKNLPDDDDRKLDEVAEWAIKAKNSFGSSRYELQKDDLLHAHRLS